MYSKYKFEKENHPDVVVRNFIRRCAEELDRDSYRSETAYVNAFLGKLRTNIPLKSIDKELVINFLTPIYDDRGANSAESKYGADFGIIYTGPDVKKAVLSQAKPKPVEMLTRSEKDRLQEQCLKMDKHTQDWMVFEAPQDNGGMPTVKFNLGRDTYSLAFDDYIIHHILGCRHGDRREGFVNAVKHSQLKKLEFIVKDLKFL
ncbi:hypothetical protein CGJ39_23540 [Vibrio parahaemolyticus]|uniref:hypothetical protein n=1 Tax=Vibrio parahaemolyticus TaxID=670 RepID=UPI0011206A26|nr:hypothetical protein [Vibrio parahaemolyticus]TOE58409.1 hypothetical protein CGJ39_23540 [Vibrio parahaemolyticus]